MGSSGSIRSTLPAVIDSGATSSVVVRVLGPVTLRTADGDVPIGGTLAKAFLALLAIESPRPVSVDRLTALLWAEEPPNAVKAALQQLASRVRRALSAVDLDGALRAVPPGYALAVDADVVDLRVFRRTGTRRGRRRSFRLAGGSRRTARRRAQPVAGHRTRRPGRSAAAHAARPCPRRRAVACRGAARPDPARTWPGRRLRGATRRGDGRGTDA